ncbi:MAG: DUF4384 domain-containing protein [Calditrichaeota bacterium]|nr:DUF4384 domain-containing protein [Calditrichota bacterium]
MKVLILLLCFGLGIQAQTHSGVVEAIGEASLEYLSQKEAIQQAMMEARRQAIEKVCGSQIAGQKVVSNFRLVADVIENLTTAKVTVLDSAIQMVESGKTPSGIPIMRVRARIRAQVNCGVQQPDPGFHLRIQLSKTRVAHGDTFYLTITPSKECYLNIFNVTGEGDVYLLYPGADPRLRQRQLQANKPWRFPYPLKAFCPPDRSQVTEWIYVVGTRFPIELFPLKEGGPYAETDARMGLVWKSQRAFYNDILLQLLEIPRNQRAESREAITVYR